MTFNQLTREFINGRVLLFNKPLYWTSFDLVRKVKNILWQQLKIENFKIGHAGTLDPLASGLMVLCTGKETRNIEKYQNAQKEYLAKIMLGATTPSFDQETEIDQYYPTSHISRNRTKTVLKELTGILM